MQETLVSRDRTLHTHLERAFERLLLIECAFSAGWVLKDRSEAERVRGARDENSELSTMRVLCDTHSQKKALMYARSLSARRTTATRSPEGSGSPGEFPGCGDSSHVRRRSAHAAVQFLTIAHNHMLERRRSGLLAE